MTPIVLIDHPPSATSQGELNNVLRMAGFNLQDVEIIPLLTKKLRDIGELFLGKLEVKNNIFKDEEGRDITFKLGAKTVYPKEELFDRVLEVKHFIVVRNPPLVITMGPLSLWTMTGESSPDKWRGSYINDLFNFPVFPTHSISRVFGEWWLRRIIVHDIAKAFKHLETPTYVPTSQFMIRPTYDEVVNYLELTLDYCGDVAVDIETTKSYYIGCIGLAVDESHAICIPFIDESYQPYFTQEQELVIIQLLRHLFLSPTHTIIMQGGSFDAQYFARDWGAIPVNVDDTMVAHHVCYNSLPKRLDFQTSLYQPWHKYWKDEGKFIDESKDFPQWWMYNCKDAVATYANMQTLREQLRTFGLVDQYKAQMDTWRRALRVQIRGVRIDQDKKLAFAMQLQETIQNLESELSIYSELFPQPTKTPWYSSPIQLANIFYNILGYPRQYKKGRTSTDDDCLHKLRKKAPLIAPLIDRILELRSLSVFYNTFMAAGLGVDGRMRTSYDVAGTETYRFASRKDAFGGGANLQNIPRNRS